MSENKIIVEGGEKKLLAFVDLCGISDFYKKQPSQVDLAKKIGRGFLGVLKNVTDPDKDRLSLHIISDSAFLVPIARPHSNKPVIGIRDIVQISFRLFIKLLEDSQGNIPYQFARIFITRGAYACIKYKTGEGVWNFTISGDALVKCDEANKKEGLPFGVFTDCPDIDIIPQDHDKNWKFVDYRSYLDKYKDFEYFLGEGLLSKILKYNYTGSDEKSIRLRNYCETLLGVLSRGEK